MDRADRFIHRFDPHRRGRGRRDGAERDPCQIATFSRIATGERFLIVRETGNVSISLNPKNYQLAAALVALAHTDSRQVLTAMSADTAVFETSDDHGYLANVSGDEPQYLPACIADKMADVRGHGTDTRKPAKHR